MHFPFVSPAKSNPHHRRKFGGKPSTTIGIGTTPTKLSIGLPSKPSTKPITTPTLKPSASASTSRKSTTTTPATTTQTTATTTSSSIQSSTSSTPDRPKSTPIPAGQPFAGRLEGGGTRDDIFGTSTYGSGYPGISGRGTAGRGFPFDFWPIAWPAAAGGAAGFYLSNNGEYGRPTNTSRPGGPLTTVSFTSALDDSNTDTSSSGATSTQPGLTYRILSDNSTIAFLVPHILTSCSPLISISTSSNTTAPYTGTGAPHPEQVIQYYRASTIALSLDGYNNSATYSPSTSSNAPDSPWPATADLNLMSCINQTIGSDAPLVDFAHSQNLIDGASSLHHVQNLSVFGAVGILWVLRLLV